MEEELNTSVNTQEVAEPVENTEATEQTAESVDGGVAAPQQEERHVQTAEENAKYAAIRRQAEQKAMDKVIAEIYGSQGITTYAQYQEAIRQQQREAEAQQRGIDPEFYNEFSSVKEELDNIKREKALMQQEQQLSSDPKVGQLFNEWKAEVKDLANQYNVDYDTAFTILARERIADVMSSQRTKAEQEAIKGLQTNAQTSPGSLSTGGNEVFFTREQVANMSQAEVNKHYNQIIKSMKNWN